MSLSVPIAAKEHRPAAVEVVIGMAAALPDAVSAVVARARRDGLDPAILERLSGQLIERVKA